MVDSNSQFTPGWIRGGLKLTQQALDIVEAAAVAAYGRNEEACGFIQGPAAEALLCDQATELENLANKYHKVDPEGHPRTGREYFKVNGMKFEKAIAEGTNTDQPVKVFFHSHLDCGAYFSEEDAASMTGGGSGSPAYQLTYLVTAVDKGNVTAHRLFIWDEKTESFQEAPFETISK